MTAVVLLRHGETTWNRERRVQGWAPTGLTDRGREQARALGEHLAETYTVGEIVASDLRRCRETADHVADAVDASVTLDSDWRERHFGVYQGLPYRDVASRHPEFDLRRTSIVGLEPTPEAGEDLAEMYERVTAAWDRVVDGIDETVAVVTHGGPLHLVLGHVKELTVAASLREARQDNGAVNEVRVEPDGARIVRENDTSYR